MEILDKKELENMDLFYNYINYRACPTSFAIASGLLSFRDENDMICSHYFVNDTDELRYGEILTMGTYGQDRYCSKLDKYLPGIRIAMKESEVNNEMLNGSMDVDQNISVIEYGYFPKSIINKVTSKVDTGIKIKLPISQFTYTPVEYKEFNVYEDEINNIYFVEYPVNTMTSIENKDYIPGAKEKFKIEPVRFWVDKKSKTLISQDVIMGGVPYLGVRDGHEYEYDDYYDSDLYIAVNVIEENMTILNELVKSGQKSKKR